MRIVQIIDSLEIGGAERMAVNYANAIFKRTGFSALVSTRHDGPLKSAVGDDVVTLSLQRKNTLDFGAIMRLRKFCVAHNITHAHAHGTSYFVAAMLKFVYPGIKVIWHDHYGLSDFLDQRKFGLLKTFSGYFCGIITVNEKLRAWAINELKCPKVIFLPNYTNFGVDEIRQHETSVLCGNPQSKILCLANLREQKDHFLLIKVAQKIRLAFPDWSFHLVGKDFKDEYSRELRETIQNENLEGSVFLYGSRPDSAKIISESEICILTSKSEGLPVALIEYGMQHKAVVATSVGDIPKVIADGETGFLAESGNEAEFSEKLIKLMSSRELRAAFGSKLKKTIEENYSEKAVIEQYFKFIQQSCP
ncbi:glycosyltransferase family 4 protein [Flavobacterium silvaticum]|uniref:Glycosyltransferase family 4 protein n=1 Tax=Flavobacterium silvaticum TaxID=1852020 RepID=A0A972JJK4_9FLAO|nr:glycosyltransferase family 4 protein [Flavobacterium silvaticum]NMH29473.1 glycosyltransferase family 4 protein [Flavobacterium silvaticum]